MVVYAFIYQYNFHKYKVSCKLLIQYGYGRAMVQQHQFTWGFVFHDIGRFTLKQELHNH